MKLRLATLVAAALALLVSVAPAAASDGGGSAEQAAGQAAASGQTAGALSGAQQTSPTNRNISVRVLSPGDGGDVTQTNTVSSDATAGNANLTGQTAEQTQAGGSCGCAAGTQLIGQSASNDQAAAALSLATQSGATNQDIPVRVLSPGDDGDVHQSNSVESDATAANANATGQAADQSQSGGGTQAIGQAAQSDQAALAASAAEQHGAENTNISVRVLSPGDDGDVTQKNAVDSDATAANVNLTGQHAAQAGGSGAAQLVGQAAHSGQAAAAASAAKQDGASNTNVPVRVLSPGDGGDVTQKNTVASDATAVNLNAAEQHADQSQSGSGCGCSGGIQAIGQSAASDQSAAALSAALQSGASNTNTPVRVSSYGDDGDVEQKNTVESDATAANLNATGQAAEQDQAAGGCCGSGGTQVIGQSAHSSQDALAASLAAQVAGHDRCGCGSGGNTNAPVRVDSHGDGGDVEQKNTVESDAAAANLNLTGQSAAQAQGGGGIQAIGQSARSEQAAAALSAALQSGASNTNAPVRIASYGDDGDVSQKNDVDSESTALNANLTGQHARQAQTGSCRCEGIGIQAIGQEAKSGQLGIAGSFAAQLPGRSACGCPSGPSNTNTPVSIGGASGAGDVTQGNSVDSDAAAANLNLTGQHASQAQGGTAGIGIQAIGQSAKNEQAALATSLALQAGASNTNAPVSVGGYGRGGDVDQSNDVDSDATALNLNALGQGATQAQRGDCGCHGSTGIQAIGQSATNHQLGVGLSAAFQLGASNVNAPYAVRSRRWLKEL